MASNWKSLRKKASFETNTNCFLNSSVGALLSRHSVVYRCVQPWICNYKLHLQYLAVLFSVDVELNIQRNLRNVSIQSSALVQIT